MGTSPLVSCQTPPLGSILESNTNPPPPNPSLSVYTAGWFPLSVVSEPGEAILAPPHSFYSSCPGKLVLSAPSAFSAACTTPDVLTSLHWPYLKNPLFLITIIISYLSLFSGPAEPRKTNLFWSCLVGTWCCLHFQLSEVSRVKAGQDDSFHQSTSLQGSRFA